MQGNNGSAVKYFVALSNNAVATALAGSTNASNFAGYEFATVLVASGSAGSGTGFLVQPMRSGTSSGTFNGFGASVAFLTKKGEGLYVRSWALNSSNTWYKFYYDPTNASTAPVIMVALHKGRLAPVGTMALDTVVSSDYIDS